jgi:Zn-dependent protease/predicted transcriptional regulator
MRWTVRLGLVRGVPVEAHWLLVLLLAWAAYNGWERGGPPGLASSTGLLAGVLASILIHEIAHTAQAQALGVPVRRILLLPFGGLAQLGRLPDRAGEELRVALAGPAANLGLALLCAGLAGASAGAGWPALAPANALRLVLLRGEPTPLYWLTYLALVNASLALFNLVPAFPFDGARALRSVLGLVIPRGQATRMVGALGWMVGLASLLLGASVARRLGTPVAASLVFIGLMAVLGTSAEDLLERQLASLRRISAGAAVRQPTWVLGPEDRLTRELAASLEGKGYAALPVVVEARVVGLLTRQDLLKARALAEAPRVQQVMRTDFARVPAQADLWQAQQLMAGAGSDSLPVLDGELLQGMLSSADIRAATLQPPTRLRVESPQLIPAGEPSL